MQKDISSFVFLNSKFSQVGFEVGFFCYLVTPGLSKDIGCDV